MEFEQYSRIIFISIVDLQKIRFNKLEKVCDKVYVFVDKQVTSVPLKLVQQLQHLGENVQWIAVSGNESDTMANYISFYLGILHEQTDLEIEFAIISENLLLDKLIQYINEQGRGCIRVTKNRQKESITSDLGDITWSPPKEEVQKVVVKKPVQKVVKEVITQPSASRQPVAEAVQVSGGTGSLPDRIAKETIKRLVLSGNRPAALKSLKDYILLQYKNEEVNQKIDTIILEMEKNKEIKIQDEEVVYNF